MRFLKLLIVIGIVCILTVLTQIGGLLFFLSFMLFRKSKKRLLMIFTITYLLSSFFIVPLIAPYFGREKIKTNDHIKVHFFLTSLANRDYVVPAMNDVLLAVSKELTSAEQPIHIHCLDANFPFWDGFPLLPHLSHNDGKKIDISLVYENKEGRIVNQKPARSGYGIFEAPIKTEYNQIESCLSKGYWQYDFPKHLTLGTKNNNLVMSNIATKNLITQFLKQSQVSKIFVEPHLRSRMNLSHPKIRYHGCKAVRHDDHIHIQLK